jgi:hypothetical protein
MRKIIAINQVTLDGVMQSPGGPEEDPRGGFTHGGWAMSFLDDAAADPGGMARAGERSAAVARVCTGNGHVAGGRFGFCSAASRAPANSCVTPTCPSPRSPSPSASRAVHLLRHYGTSAKPSAIRKGGLTTRVLKRMDNEGADTWLRIIVAIGDLADPPTEARQ